MPDGGTNTRTIIARLEKDGWINIGGGRHDRFVLHKRPEMMIPVPRHRELTPGTARSIAKTAGWIWFDDTRGDQETTVAHFVGIIDGAGDVWGVRFPDVDGCVGAGETPEAAVEDATAALRDVMEHKRSGGFAMPRASTLAEVIASGVVGSNEATVLIPLLLDAGRTVRANLTFDAGLLSLIDEEARRRGLTRAAFMASAAREKIEAHR